MSDLITVAAVQMTSGKVLTDNLRAAEVGLERAAAGGARLALLPENFAGYGVNYRELAARYDDLLAWLGSRRGVINCIWWLAVCRRDTVLTAVKCRHRGCVHAVCCWDRMAR